jgi:hypothetical protein
MHGAGELRAYDDNAVWPERVYDDNTVSKESCSPRDNDGHDGLAGGGGVCRDRMQGVLAEELRLRVDRTASALGADARGWNLKEALAAS